MLYRIWSTTDYAYIYMHTGNTFFSCLLQKEQRSCLSGSYSVYLCGNFSNANWEHGRSDTSMNVWRQYQGWIIAYVNCHVFLDQLVRTPTIISSLLLLFPKQSSSALDFARTSLPTAVASLDEKINFNNQFQAYHIWNAASSRVIYYMTFAK